jgi:pyruvate/2-oxoglutarate dehydrogenase complex dihydrolipoamide dehydrogenase (E3) component
MSDNRYDFPAEYKTEVFINGNNTITVRQLTDDINDPESMVVIGSKKRAVEIARAIRALSMMASFETEQEES